MTPHPAELVHLLLDLRRVGIELAPHPTDPARIRFRRKTPTGWTADLPGDPEARYVCFERLGVADDLGLPTHPGSAAWLIAVWEALAVAPNPVYTRSNRR